MKQTFNSFIHHPGGENEGGGTDPKADSTNNDDVQPDTTKDATKEKGFLAKIKDALKDWSNDDQRQQQIDDATP